jgi:hypothetical protein
MTPSHHTLRPDLIYYKATVNKPFGTCEHSVTVDCARSIAEVRCEATCGVPFTECCSRACTAACGVCSDLSSKNQSFEIDQPRTRVDRTAHEAHPCGE